MDDNLPIEDNYDPDRFITDLINYIHKYSEGSELKALNWYAQKIGKKNVDELCYMLINDKEGAEKRAKESDSEMDEFITQEFYRSNSVTQINEKISELSEDEKQEMMQIELLFLKKTLAFVRFDKNYDPNLKIEVAEQFPSVIERIKASSIFSQQGKETFEFLLKENAELLEYLKRQMALKPYYLPNKITLDQLEDLFMELERNGFVSNLSEFRKLLSGKYTFDHEARMVWNEKGTALIYLYYCLYRDRYYRWESLNEIIPKFFSHVEGKEVNAESLRVSLATLIGRIGTDFSSSQLSSHQNKIKVILIQKGIIEV